MEPTILLHSCCGPCATASVERLLEEGRKPVLYFSNSNIMTLEEFQKREETLSQVARHFRVPMKTDKWNNLAWEQAIAGLEDEPEGGSRCRLCFRYNLNRTAEKAAEMGIPFSTTLTLSPHKSSPVIFEEGHGSAHFEEHNFKKKEGFKRSLELSSQLELYRQDWCGCRFSLRK